MPLLLNFKQALIRLFFSCDGLKGFVINYPETFLLSSKGKVLKSLGATLSSKRKFKRLKIIETANSPLRTPILISIILPALNAEKTIVKAINSILEQSYPHWELLIINDGSTDATMQVIGEFSQRDARIKVYNNTVCKGAAYARNVGLFYAKGEYITFHDADDTSHPERLEYLLSTLLMNAKTQIVISQYVRVDSVGKPYLINGRKRRNYISGMMISKQTRKQVGYFKALKISEDSEYYERIIASYGKQARTFICKTLYYALFSPDSLLFSNASVTVNGRILDYQIDSYQRAELESCRLEHKKITAGDLSPYQAFAIDNEITSAIDFDE